MAMTRTTESCANLTGSLAEVGTAATRATGANAKRTSRTAAMRPGLVLDLPAMRRSPLESDFSGLAFDIGGQRARRGQAPLAGLLEMHGIERELDVVGVIEH